MLGSCSEHVHVLGPRAVQYKLAPTFHSAALARNTCMCSDHLAPFLMRLPPSRWSIKACASSIPGYLSTRAPRAVQFFSRFWWYFVNAHAILAYTSTTSRSKPSPGPAVDSRASFAQLHVRRAPTGRTHTCRKADEIKKKITRTRVSFMRFAKETENFQEFSENYRKLSVPLVGVAALSFCPRTARCLWS